MRISCGIFQQEEEVIRGMQLQINQLKRPDIRKIRAEDLLWIVEKLLECWMYEKERTDCQNCEEFCLSRRNNALSVMVESEEER